MPVFVQHKIIRIVSVAIQPKVRVVALELKALRVFKDHTRLSQAIIDLVNRGGDLDQKVAFKAATSLVIREAELRAIEVYDFEEVLPVRIVVNNYVLS